MLTIARLLAAVAVAASLAACGGVSSPSSQTQDEFTGTVDPIGQSSNNFSVGKTSEMSITLLSLTPRPVLGFIGLAIGTPSGGGCAPYGAYAIAQAAIGQTYALGQVAKGSYCVLVIDGNGILTTTASYAVRVIHS